MLTKLSLFFCVMCAIFLLGCAKTETNTNSNANTAATKTTTPASTTATTASADKIGVPECDEYIAAYDACVSGKVPEAQRAQFNAGLTQWRSSWKKLAETPQGKATLPGICKTQLDTAKTTMKAFACTW